MAVVGDQSEIERPARDEIPTVIRHLPAPARMQTLIRPTLTCDDTIRDEKTCRNIMLVRMQLFA